jgi:hypothetical protein
MKKKAPHPATMAQAKAPHPATVAQARAPHPATVARAKAPHPATIAQARLAHPAEQGTVVQRMNVGTELVLSGHGDFSAMYLETEGRRKLATFPVPAGINITFYAPDGAALDNDVANLIEAGRYPVNADLELRQNDGSKIQPLSAEYPRTFVPNEGVLNYTLAPPARLAVVRGLNVFTVDEKTSLYDLVAAAVLVGLRRGGTTHIHWAACGSFRAEQRWADLFPYRGWYCRLK